MREGKVTLRHFYERWHHLILFGEEERSLVFFLKECLGEHKGGLLFVGCNKEEGQMFILKCDEYDDCYMRVGNTGDDDQDWECIGHLMEVH